MIPRNLRHLRLFLAVADLASVTRASDLYNVSQPAVTQALGKLESQSGGPLFDRTRQGFFLTPRGRALADRCTRAFDLLDRALNDLSARLPLTATSAQLQALIAVAEVENFTLAARAMGLSQPTVHRAVSQLEQEADEPLFQRTAHGMVATRACQALARNARLAFAELDQADVDLAELDGKESGKIVIGTLPLSRSVLLPPAFQAFRAERPNLMITVVDGTYDMLLAGLRRGEIDMMLGALRHPLPIGDVVQERLFHDRSAIVARPGHPLAGQGPIPVADLARHPWIVPRPGSQLRTQFDQMFAQSGVAPPTSIIEAGFILLIREFLALNDGLAFISERQVMAELEKGHLVQIPTQENLPLRDIGLTCRMNWLPTKPQRLMLDALYQAARNLPPL